eukprot:TRINITY_DN362_c0_g2_i1.p1 TRINITY_DN362_c0_g2~~TRINITY_DN362_c0_g2_i1.p1  ORF type:complete len:192 (-),score=15.02 TRINITY_DN362_c0_g2_i1:381-956(-)
MSYSDDDDEPESKRRHGPTGLLGPEKMIIPPLNFSVVFQGIYRSGYPHPRNFEYLRTIGLKSILCLCVEDYLAANVEFLQAANIQLFRCGFEGNKEPFQSIPEEKMAEALSIVLDTRNHPILVHCNKGKHRTGCLFAILRKMSGWTLTASLDEYARFAGSKRRNLDYQFIESFEFCNVRVDPLHKPAWLMV